jgi:diaminohydroxyphosphoribosylaminopyrimidine deaminase/5-amino-6-(5-phosphoribosylamino)uracil reductase
MSVDAADFGWMTRALQLARRGLYSAHPNPRVGCVIVARGMRVGEGWHERTGGPHAEVVALQAAGAQARGATAYVTLEPCSHHGRTPPCAEALLRAGISRVVYAVGDANPRVAGSGARALEAAGVVVDAGVLAAAARELNIGFFSRMERQRPWVRLKIAASLDGRTALADGASRWITGEAARRDAHAWRARSSAVLTGVGTVLGDDPALTVRRADLGVVSPPARLVLDSRLRTPPGARLLREPGHTYIFCSAAAAAARLALEQAGARVEALPERSGRPDLGALMQRLAAMEVNELLVEAGPILNGALLEAGLVDEIVCYLAPHVLGGEALGMFATAPLAGMGARWEFELIETRRVGADLRLTYRARSG